MIGGMVAQQVSVPLNVVLNMSGAELNVLDTINGILPGILEVGLVLLLLKLLKKKVNILLIIFSILAVCILGAAAGIF